MSSPSVRAVFFDVGETLVSERRVFERWADRLVVGAAGNQPAGAEAWLRRQLGPGVHVASSASWGVEKPSPGFFGRLLELAGLPAAEVAYVGDRVDNDIAPAAALGMRTVFVERGPWGLIQGAWPEAERADARVGDLDDAAAAVLSFGA